MIKLPEPATVTVLQGIPYYSKAQLLQFGRDLLELAAQIAELQTVESDETTYADVAAAEIRTFIKKVPE